MANGKFRSPLRKLVTFFEVSRDKWKEKCQQVKYQFKLLKRRFQTLEKSRDLWQQRYQEAQTDCEQLQAQREHLLAQNQKLQAKVDALAKKGETHLLACQDC